LDASVKGIELDIFLEREREREERRKEGDVWL